MIVVEKLAKSFGDVKAVKNVSLQAQDGQITTLLGANGSGKTTAFRAVAGLLAPDAGHVDIDGIAVARDPLAAQRRLGFFPDTFGLYPRLTAREHMAYYAELHGMRGHTLSKSIEDTAALLKIHDILDRRTDGFSQGQRMKVALARTLVHAPPNIVLDEPTRGLDVMSIRMMRDILRALRAEGRCVLLSSHVMAEVEAVSDHIVMIAEGEVCAEGTTQELIAQAGTENLEDAFVKITGMDERTAA